MMVFKKYFSYWILPVISGLVWVGTLLGLLLHWIIDTDRTHYPSMDDNTTIAYISDVGAFELKPLFVSGSAITVVFLDASLLADRWLRHRGRLVPNSSLGEKVLSWLTILFAVLGAAGLILLSVFDTNTYPTAHLGFLLLFMAGYVFSAVFLCWEYQRLGAKNRNHRVLRVGFWIKLTFILVETVLSAIFISTLFTIQYDVGAVFEWMVAFIFSLYVFSFVIDLYPAIYTKQGAQFPRDGLNSDLEDGGDGDGLAMGEAGSHDQVMADHRLSGSVLSPSPTDNQGIFADDGMNLAPGTGPGMQTRHYNPNISKAGPPPNDF